jgi:RHS repeat-associated protein
LTKETFTGKEQDTESNLHYFGARYYDAGIGKWLSVDPVNYITWSSYTFSFNRPITVYDPNGASGEDMTKTGKDIAAKKYYYCWGGKNPDNAYLQIGKKKFKNFDQILKKASLSRSSPFLCVKI